MKKYLFYQLAKHASRGAHHHQKQRWIKRLKYFAAFAFVGTLLLGGLAIWGTVALVNSFAGSLNQAAIHDGVIKGQEGLKSLATQPITTKACLETLGGLLSPERLLTVPIAKNMDAIRTSCWEKATEPKKTQS